MSDVIVPCLINFMPLVVTLSGWTRAYRSRRSGFHPFAFALLGIVTMLAALAAGEFIYFEFRPVHLPPWRSPQIALLGWFLLLGPASMLLGFLARGREPKWLFWVIESASIWLFGLGILAGLAY